MRCGWRSSMVVGALAAVLLGTLANGVWAAGVDAHPDQLVIHVWKARHELWLEEGDRVLRKFPVALGENPAGTKHFRGDRLTPEGRYYVCEKHAHSRFHRFLGISYPNVDDAERAYDRHLISADEWADIFFANLAQTTPPWATPLGGRVGIHGYGSRPFIAVDWTDGCIAVSNDAIDYLYDTVPVGTPVIISGGDGLPLASTAAREKVIVDSR